MWEVFTTCMNHDKVMFKKNNPMAKANWNMKKKAWPFKLSTTRTDMVISIWIEYVQISARKGILVHWCPTRPFGNNCSRKTTLKRTFHGRRILKIWSGYILPTACWFHFNHPLPRFLKNLLGEVPIDRSPPNDARRTNMGNDMHGHTARKRRKGFHLL